MSIHHSLKIFSSHQRASWILPLGSLFLWNTKTVGNLTLLFRDYDLDPYFSQVCSFRIQKMSWEGNWPSELQFWHSSPMEATIIQWFFFSPGVTLYLYLTQILSLFLCVHGADPSRDGCRGSTHLEKVCLLCSFIPFRPHCFLTVWCLSVFHCLLHCLEGAFGLQKTRLFHLVLPWHQSKTKVAQKSKQRTNK